MELRSSTIASRTRNSCEIREKQKKLKELGLYEEGMDLEQMREILHAIKESETCFNDNEIKMAITESERDFIPKDVLNSTMIGLSNRNFMEGSYPRKNFNFRKQLESSPFSSPEVAAQQFDTVAEVHHEFNWSPVSVSDLDDRERTNSALYCNANEQSPPEADSGIILSATASELMELTPELP